MLRRLKREEAGATLGLVVIMIVLIGVMGAGLLTFVNRDLATVVEVNQGQRALEVAEAGVRAAQRQILADSNATSNYDGGLGSESPWSYCYNVLLCTSLAPTPTGSSGMRLNYGSDYATVTILETTDATPTYKVVSDGRVGDARRKVEAIFTGGGATNAPRAYFTYGQLTLTGSATSNGASFFARGNVYAGGAFNLTSTSDAYFGKWAAGTNPGSYPNQHNAVPRPSNLIGIGSYGTIVESGGFNSFKGTRSFDSTTTPRAVESFSADGNPGQQSSEIGFPFKVLNATEDQQNIESLRQRALALEQLFPGSQHYIDSIPGNGVDNAGMPNRTSNLIINSWYAVNDYQTVRFYEFQTYSTSNVVNYGSSPLPSCSSTLSLPRGIIVVQNGDFYMSGNRAFDGAVLVRAYDSSGNTLPPPSSPSSMTNGSFRGEGSACLKGYANSSGNMQVAGDLTAGGIPDMASQFGSGSLQIRAWRELYQ